MHLPLQGSHAFLPGGRMALGLVSVVICGTRSSKGDGHPTPWVRASSSHSLGLGLVLCLLP